VILRSNHGLTRWIEAQILGGLSSYKDGRSAFIGREDDEHPVRNGGPKLRVIRDRRIYASSNSILRQGSRAQIAHYRAVSASYEALHASLGFLSN
jgi:hypothetical protein